MPYFSNQLLAGAKNCMINCAGVHSGQHVLILNLIGDRNNRVDETAVQALAAVAQEQGAHVQILWATGMEKSWWDDLSPIVLGAFRSADVVINNTMAIGRPMKAIREAMFDQGVVMVRNMATTEELLSSDWATFPYPLSDEIMKRVGDVFDQGTTWRIVHPNGTDISGKIGAVPTKGTGMRKYGQHRGNAKNRPFPQGVFNPLTSEDANGIMIIDRTLPWEARHIGVPELQFSRPIKITVENNKMVNFEGGMEAERYRRFYDGVAPFIGEDTFNLSGWHAGINPKAKIYESVERYPDSTHMGSHNHPKILHFHLGGSLGKEYNYPFMWHLSCEIKNATVYVDGEKLYDKGHLTILDDPSMREFASQFGDPDSLLHEAV